MSNTSQRPFAIAIMAAGKGTRMKSETTPKVLHSLAGRSMLGHVLHAAYALNPEKIHVIVGHCAEQVQNFVQTHGSPTLHERLGWVEQKEQLGTGHAIMQLMPVLENFKGNLMILNGDVPLLRSETLKELLETHEELDYAATLLTTRVENPSGYGRIVRLHEQFVRIVEHKDASPQELALKEINTGVYIFSWPILEKYLPKISNANAKGEYYLTDVIEMLVHDRQRIGTVTAENPLEVLGVNSRKELAEMECILRKRINDHWMEAGVTLRDPSSIYIDSQVQLGVDIEILPGTLLQGYTKIGDGSKIGPHCEIRESVIGENCEIRFSVLDQVEIKDQAKIGPYAHLRPETVIERNAKVGNFVELKKTHLGEGAKASHLSYLGDAEIGKDCNIGAGTITCNYDGANKHQTTLKEGVFVGSNSTLIAPLTLGEQAFIAAGSVISEDVPAGALGLGRSRQTNKEGWSEHRRPKK
ncbi:bifunctional N-acetylglucosamine-1-phosphate uridyltransferase/glucosamine-1-phosphate acetyltransferase [bacterium (Candidatus Blackallbacteria) CG17_big_fil_post_rev_8_21_14_2_50_48_46]|uniref:Bifunctional protein GlmU n=1 Tax=bacterium (Candidatus Blackallbacteria) CG17_big_fil_post_rev_8_21_14_2_50_48_46 TaxID=2014261 RepID=A0A2M7G3V1_9BACT|nr:MAG: bifunctional N-acetylglucosamine-1-phosphate uridyltransferase/glucosamine-1-phosphate acetyltransferase [bacterium (Candidatus Blackallbacteria) CG18_big_fil_WC_8_21_14_2_50_49_26]PIW16497.1 MAG: bifunctional N-acetylglucosamine-1-phosphate uridyltransferase/glucosamine-1-phosphate acetyltransferase [bacterium (Candidatus Blackallbacteria) CG17_big_fil_post_rev_8_21_14_2_50_48_46]PIW46005.1 MAG: bifunctional N-acetylglucosamine-1-phosphate uridyltransferase/glucosamine-1-phosphate acetyl